MTSAMKNKVKNELKRAYRYFGEFDEELMEENAANEVDALYCRMNGSYPKTISTDDGEISGYEITVIVADFDKDKIGVVTRNSLLYNRDSVLAIELVVSDTADMCYVIHTFDILRHIGETEESFVVENSTYKKVALEDINPRDYCDF